MLPYLIKSSLMLIVLYGCFVALLGKETFFRLNRIVLLSIIMSVLIIPALNITLPKPDFSDIWDEELSYTPINTEPLNPIPLDMVDEESSAEATQMPLIPSEEQILIEYPEEPTPFPWPQIIIGIYLLGLAWRVGLFVWQMLLFSKEIKRGVRHRDQYGNKIAILSGDFVPYSFFHHIVISVKDYEQLRTPILVHEQAHAKLGHSWDIMLLEILCAIQWFNPFCYMLARELRCVHEYEADNEVLNHGIDATQYQQLLVIKAVGKQLQSFANNFNRNSLKKRIIMMNKQKSHKRLMLRGLFLPLAVVIAVIACAKPKAETPAEANDIGLLPSDTLFLKLADAESMETTLKAIGNIRAEIEMAKSLVNDLEAGYNITSITQVSPRVTVDGVLKSDTITFDPETLQFIIQAFQNNPKALYEALGMPQPTEEELIAKRAKGKKERDRLYYSLRVKKHLGLTKFIPRFYLELPRPEAPLTYSFGDPAKHIGSPIFEVGAILAPNRKYTILMMDTTMLASKSNIEYNPSYFPTVTSWMLKNCDTYWQPWYIEGKGGVNMGSHADKNSGLSNEERTKVKRTVKELRSKYEQIITSGNWIEKTNADKIFVVQIPNIDKVKNVGTMDDTKIKGSSKKCYAIEFYKKGRKNAVRMLAFTDFDEISVEDILNDISLHIRFE